MSAGARPSVYAPLEEMQAAWKKPNGQGCLRSVLSLALRLFAVCWLDRGQKLRSCHVMPRAAYRRAAPDPALLSFPLAESRPWRQAGSETSLGVRGDAAAVRVVWKLDAETEPCVMCNRGVGGVPLSPRAPLPILSLIPCGLIFGWARVMPRWAGPCQAEMQKLVLNQWFACADASAIARPDWLQCLHDRGCCECTTNGPQLSPSTTRRRARSIEKDAGQPQRMQAAYSVVEA